MRAMPVAIFAMWFALPIAQAQTSDKPPAPQIINSPIGLDSAALAGSARTSKVIGSKVYRGDIAIGQIEDVLITLDRATVSAVILSVGGFLGMNEKLVAVTPDQIKVSSEARFTTDLTKDQLSQAPAFDLGSLK